MGFSEDMVSGSEEDWKWEEEKKRKGVGESPWPWRAFIEERIIFET